VTAVSTFEKTYRQRTQHIHPRPGALATRRYGSSRRACFFRKIAYRVGSRTTWRVGYQTLLGRFGLPCSKRLTSFHDSHVINWWIAKLSDGWRRQSVDSALVGAGRLVPRSARSRLHSSPKPLTSWLRIMRLLTYQVKKGRPKAATRRVCDGGTSLPEEALGRC
jgi:hypothetical protein